METSSPLAAVHRPMIFPSWASQDMFRPRPSVYTGASMMGLSLREQLHRSTSDYFTAKDVRGSSPAASLAADLSQNFRIDNEASPHFPTPRRALFTANMMGGMETRGFCTTPPLPSSSPAPLTETMEISPLPHKTPFFSQLELEINSPTPISTPTQDIQDEEMMLDSPAPITRQTSLEPPRHVVADRKLALPRRPSLSRMKNFTTSAVPSRSQTADNQHPPLPPFRFGANKLSHMSSNPNMSLGECFESASPPPQERRPQSAESPCAPVPLTLRIRPQFSGVGSNSRYASPSNAHTRRPSNPFLRNRKQFRRSLSMFEHPADVMKPQPEGQEPASSRLQAVMDIEEPHEPVLPHFMPDDPSDTIPRISRETLLQVLDGEYKDQFDQKMIIDCRFEYEYEGGHIDGAVNYNDKDLLANQLFNTPMSSRTLIVFHCEYSAHRAPLMARHVRSQDRTANAEHYPRLTYPEVYILDGGYSEFFAEHRGRCFPPEYVEMSDANHQRTCEREMGRLKTRKEGRKGLGRAQTFAFGQREPCFDESPTGPCRPTLSRHLAMNMIGNSPISRQIPIDMIGNSPILGERCATRRMASY